MHTSAQGAQLNMFFLQPANLLSNEACELKICDFGLARSIKKKDRLEQVPLRRQLTTHVVTRWYRAPEVILKNEEYDFAVDTWSAGCIFAELLMSLSPGAKVRRFRHGKYRCYLSTGERSLPRLENSTT